MDDASKYLAHSLGDSLMTLSEAEEGKLRHQEAPVAIHLDPVACLLGLHQNVGLGFGYLKHIARRESRVQVHCIVYQKNLYLVTKEKNLGDEDGDA